MLVETSHPGNIGAAARALKNMQLDELVLVRPKLFPHPEASARASGAEDLLSRARVEAELGAALEGCGLVLATTSRERDQYFRVLDVREAARRAWSSGRAGAGGGAVRLRTRRADQRGAATTRMRCCASRPIRTMPSLNLAMAVQIVAYEILRAAAAQRRQARARGAAPRPLATPERWSSSTSTWPTVLEEIDFRDRTQSGTHLMKRMRRLLQRAEPDANEVNILRGILTAVQQRRRRRAGLGERAVRERHEGRRCISITPPPRRSTRALRRRWASA